MVPATFIYEDGAGKPADTTANQAPAPAGREQPVPTPATPANTVTASRAVRPPSLPPEPPPAASPTPAIIRNADLIRLARNGTTESEIVRLLTSSRSELDTSIPALVQLKNEGVSDAIINAMLASSRTAAPALLRNADVVQMVRSGQPDAAVIATIRRSKAEFDVSISGLVALKKDGVSDAVIEAVLAAMKKP